MDFKEKTKVAIITNVLPIYREGFYQRLFSNDNLEITVYCQEKIKGANYKTIHQKYHKNVHLLKSISTDKGLFIWQFIPVIKILKTSDIVFVDGNPRILSQAIFATFLQLIGKKVVVWSMVHSHINNNFTKNIRIKWLKLFKNHFLYNDFDILKLKEIGGFENKNIVAMNNGLDQKKIDAEIARWPKEKLINWQKKNHILNKNIIVSCGRLIEKNNYELIIHAIKIIKETIPDILWCCIGDGDQALLLQKLVAENSLENNVKFAGEIYEEADLCPWFLSSKIFVHPAGIGLSIIQAFGFGLPLITHGKAELHGPEYIAFENNKTGLNYEMYNINDLAQKIMKLLESDEKLQITKDYVQSIVREKYNVDMMSTRFLEMVSKVINKNK